MNQNRFVGFRGESIALKAELSEPMVASVRAEQRRSAQWHRQRAGERADAARAHRDRVSELQLREDLNDEIAVHELAAAWWQQLLDGPPPPATA